MKDLIDKTITFVKERLQHAEGGHDWSHTERVWKNARIIAAHEPVNLMVVELAALLHDIADSKFHNGDESLGPAIAQNFLSQHFVEEEVIQQVVDIIRHMSFKGGNEPVTFFSAEMQVVQDADRLDAIGAIGIARAFNYGGYKNRPLHDPSISPKLDMGREEYKKQHAPTINHFYEKLLLLKDRMNTATAKKMAEKRHQFMLDFLDRFFEEWDSAGVEV